MKISVITVSFNAAQTLADTLRSVALQTHGDVDHWLVDGVSRDTTLEVARAHGAHLAGWVSEPDRGLYDAMNKGARLCSGSVIGFLNADDWYASEHALQWVAAAFEQGADLVYGNLDFVEPQAPYAVRRVWRDAAHEARDFFRSGWQPAHPTTFVRRSVFEAAGGFDLRWRIGADYAFMAHTMRQPGLRLAHLPYSLVNMRLGGASTAGVSSVWKANRECASALRDMGVRWPWRTVGMKLARKIPQVLNATRPAGSGTLWRPWDG